MSNFLRFAPLCIALLSYAFCGAMLLFDNELVRWLNIVVLGAALATVDGFEGALPRRIGRTFLSGLVTSGALVIIAMVISWARDRSHFYDDGGPLGLLLIVSYFFGVPATLLGVLFCIAMMAHRRA